MHHMHIKVWDEIFHSYSNFNGSTIEVWEWSRDVIPHFIMEAVTNHAEIKPY